MHTGRKPTPRKSSKRSGRYVSPKNCETALLRANAGPAASTSDEGVDQIVSNCARRIQAAQVRALCANISDMTLWRWIHERDFPKPIYIGRRRYWRESDVLAWLDSQNQRR